MPHLLLTIHGRVQGVWYRESARRRAETLGIKGFARNDPRGTVTIEAESADEAALLAFVAWCQQGPPLARVVQVTQQAGPMRGYAVFEVRR